MFVPSAILYFFKSKILLDIIALSCLFKLANSSGNRDIPTLFHTDCAGISYFSIFCDKYHIYKVSHRCCLLHNKTDLCLYGKSSIKRPPSFKRPPLISPPPPGKENV